MNLVLNLAANIFSNSLNLFLIYGYVPVSHSSIEVIFLNADFYKYFTS